MDFSVVYFNRGFSCNIRLFTSIYSLRKHYHGPVTLMQEGPISDEAVRLLKDLSVNIQAIRQLDVPVLVRKSALWRELQTEYAVYLDSDTIVCGPIDELIAWTRQHGFVATWFNKWMTTGGQMRRRIEAWRIVAPELIDPALKYGKAINTGVQGWSGRASVLPEYEELTRRGHAANRSRVILDEIAMQLLLPKHQHYMADHVWNTSGVFGDTANAKIIHYHGKKHCQFHHPPCDEWKSHYFDLVAKYPQHSATLTNVGSDRRLRRFLKGCDGRRKDLTIVTAVDPAYASKLRRNILAWMKVTGLRQQRFLVFVNGFASKKQRQFLDLPNVEVVRWNYPHAQASRREFMLAAFIFGVARHVKTAYWMKLDADCQPQRGWWEWPEYADHTIVSHRWGYTRMKGDSGADHWFNRLDQVFCPNAPYFKRRYEAGPACISHARGNRDSLPGRFNSYCHIERTEFTRRIAHHLDVYHQGKLPIPSQDTISWYCSVIWGERVKLLNMRKWFKN